MNDDYLDELSDEELLKRFLRNNIDHAEDYYGYTEEDLYDIE